MADEATTGSNTPLVTKFKITNVHIFGQNGFGEPQSLMVEDGKIVAEANEAHEIDGECGFLLPGLIDAHVHLRGVEQFEKLSKWGVTTALDMACFPLSQVEPFRNQKGMTDFRSAGVPATSPGSLHSKILPLPTESLLNGPENASQFVAQRISEGSDYIKVISDIPGPSQAILTAVTKAAHEHGKLCVAHASSYTPYHMAQTAGVDVVTHVPLDKALDAAAASQMAENGRIAVPTLVMMFGVAKSGIRPGLDYAHSRESVTALHKAGVPILAGTDANAHPAMGVPHGESLHRELELMVEAGMSTIEVLQAATALPAKYFDLGDRGVIEAGKRADLLLLSQDPLKDIKATRSIRRVWCQGVEVHV